MSERKLHERLTLAKHPDLLNKINETIIGVKIHNIDSEEKKQKPGEYAKAATIVSAPTWENIVELLQECYKAINEQREDPRRY